MSALISVIVPVYNKEAAIEKCIKSIVAQSHSSWELLLIDDGSTDNSRTVITEYLSDPRIHYYYKPNGGVSSARNMGLDKATGDWVIFLDADDYFEPYALETLLTTALDYNCTIATANFSLERNCSKIPACSGWRRRLISNNFRAWYFVSAIPRPGAALFHKSVFSIVRFNEKLKRYEDAQLLFDILRTNRMAYSPRFVMTYAQDFSSLSRELSHPESDFIFYMDFEGKSFWEKMVLGTLLNEGFSAYPKLEHELRKKYAKYLKYVIIDCKIRRFKRWRKAIYQLISKIRCSETYSHV